MIVNPIKIFKLRQQVRTDRWLTDWVQRCLDDPQISFKGKVQLLSGYYTEQHNTPAENWRKQT